MSFHRLGHSRRKRATSWKKPVWDDTVQDLTVYRASPEEIMLRKEAHKSKNHLSVRLENMRTDLHKNKQTGAETHQLAIMKEILYDQNQLQEVLAKSDTMMAVVRDLFGDDPKRFAGFPNVTTAPNFDGDHSSLTSAVPDIYTRIEKLSDSMMDQSALNDDLDTFDSEDEEVDCPDPISFESKLNLQHFKDYLQEERSKTDQLAPKPMSSQPSKTHSNENMLIITANNNLKMDRQGKVNKEDPTQVLSLLKSYLNQSNEGQSQFGNPQAVSSLLAHLTANFQTPTKRYPPIPSERTPPSAMNDTNKIKRNKKCVKSPKVSSEGVNTTTSMNDMRKVLQELENEISSYEHQTGRCTQEETHKTETFSGYTVALVTAVSRLARYLREDLIVTQEEYGNLHSEFKRYRDSTDLEMRSLHCQLRELRHLVTGKESRSESENQQQQNGFPQQQNYHNPTDTSNVTKQNGFPQQQNYHNPTDTSNFTKQAEKTSKTSTPLCNQDTSPQSGSESGTYQPLPSRLRHFGTTAAAVMLSPPVRKTRVQTSSKSVDAEVQLSKRQVLMNHEAVTNSADPPRLSQTPPVVNTVSVPRPIPLVQSNVSIPIKSAGLSSSRALAPGHAVYNGQGRKAEGATGQSGRVAADLVTFGDEMEQQLQQLQETAFEDALNNPDMQLLMQAQIAELNRQQEEARHKLLDLLDNQKVRQKQLQDQIALDNELNSSTREGSQWQSNVHKQSVSPPISPIAERSEHLLETPPALQ